MIKPSELNPTHPLTHPLTHRFVGHYLCHSPNLPGRPKSTCFWFKQGAFAMNPCGQKKVRRSGPFIFLTDEQDRAQMSHL